MCTAPHLTVDVVSSAEQPAPNLLTTQPHASAASPSGFSLPTLSPLTLYTSTTPDITLPTQLRVVPPPPSFERPDPLLDLTASSPVEEDVHTMQGSSCSSTDAHSHGETTERRGSSDWVFVHRLYDMLTDELNEPWIAFSNSGDTFNVFDPDTFAQNVLPRYFRHRNFQSFVRQLNLYNFRKVLAARSVPRAKSTKGEQEAWEFHNPDFHRDRPDDVHLIKRRVSTGPSPTRSRRNSEAVLGRPSLSNVAHLSDYQLPVRPASAYGSQSSSQTATNDERASSSSPFAIPFVPPAGADPPRPHPRRQPSYPPSTLPRGRSRTAPSPTSLGPSHPAKSTPRRPFTARTPDELDPILIERKSLHSTVKKYRFDLGVLSYQVREGQARMWSLLQLTWQLKQLVKQLGGERELANFPFHVFDPRLADFSIPLSVIENDFASKSTAQAAYAFPQPHPADSSVATVYPSSHPVAQPTAMCAHEVAVPPTTVPSGLTVPASSPHTRSHSAPEQGIRRYESYESAYSLPESQLGFDQSTDFAYEPTESIVEDSWLSAYLADPPSQYSSRSASSLGEASIATSGRSSYSESSSPASSFIEVPMHDTYDAHLAYSTLGQALQGG